MSTIISIRDRKDHGILERNQSDWDGSAQNGADWIGIRLKEMEYDGTD